MYNTQQINNKVRGLYYETVVNKFLQCVKKTNKNVVKNNEEEVQIGLINNMYNLKKPAA